MQKGKYNTKERILTVAIKLFSQKGYYATSMRKIAKEVGIRESAIYNHYSSKENIFLEISNKIVSLPSPTHAKNIKNAKEFLQNYVTSFKKVTLDLQHRELFQLLMIELLQNKNLRKQFIEDFHTQSSKELSKIFFNMMQESLIKSADPMLLAYEFLSTLFYIRLHITLLLLDEKEDNFIEEMFEKHVDFFWENIKI